MKTNVTRDLIKFRAEPEIRKALRLRAVYDDTNLTTVILDAIRIHLADQLREVRQRSTSSTTGAEYDKSSHRRKA